jgi:amino acid transporter
MGAVTADHKPETLARGRIGLPAVLFQSITDMGPAASVAFSIPAGIAFGGGSMPLAVLFALVACLLVAISIGQLSKHMPSAGSFYTYSSNAISPSFGFMVAWAYSFIAVLVAADVAELLGFSIAQVMNEEFGWPTGLWWLYAAFWLLFIFSIGWFGIRASTRVGAVMGTFELLVFVALAITLISQAHHNTLSVFGTGLANNPHFKGLSGVISGSVFTILAFLGFESAAPLSEESRAPKKTVFRAVVLSCVIIGAFYLLTTYSAGAFFDPAKMITFGTAGAGNPWQNLLSRSFWGPIGFAFIFLAILNSNVANTNGGYTAATRTLYSMGRIRLLPAALSRVDPRFRAPRVALIAQLVISLGVCLWLGAQYSPLTAYALIATVIVEIFIPIYMIINLSAALFYWRHRRSEFRWVVHGLVPLLGILVFVPPFFAGAGIPVFKFITPLPPPMSYAGIVDGIWVVLGIAYLFYLRANHPERITATQEIMKVDASEAAPGDEVIIGMPTAAD